MSTTRLQSLLALIKPFDELDKSHQRTISIWKNTFPDCPDTEEQLSACLEILGAPQLKPYLAWVPPDELFCFQPLAKGGFAKVYKTKIYVNGPPFWAAAKELKPSMLALNVYLSRCVNSSTPTMDVLGLSRHPDIGEYLMIMQFADTGTLENKPCDPDSDWYTTLTYATQLASRLASLHEMGFNHEDLHPGNVVFHKSLATLMIDVGLSRGVTEAHSEEGVYGRIGYLPPESFENCQYTQKSDVFCLGTLLWQLIVGVSPRDLSCNAVVSNPDGMREEEIVGAPVAFNNIIRGCWQPNPNDRPSASEVYNQLIEFAADLAGISPVPQSEAEEQILDALAIAPIQFSPEMQLFIIARRAAQQQEQGIDDTDGFEFAECSASVFYTTSKFHTNDQLKQVSGWHSQTEFVTVGKHPEPASASEYNDIEENSNNIETSNDIEENINDIDETSALTKSLEKTSLTELNLNEIKISDEEVALVRLLEESTTSTELDLSSKGIQDRASRILAEFLKKATNLTKLDISDNNFGTLLCRTLAGSLRSMNLTELIITDNTLEAEEVRILAKSLERNTTLTKLIIGHNGYSDEGARILANYLKNNETLIELDIKQNLIHKEGAKALAELLAQNKTLTKLNFERNVIENEGAEALAWALRQNTTLTELNLTWNSITAKGAAALAKALKQNTTLTQLNLRDNDLHEEGARVLAEFLKQNASLTDLNLQNTKIGGEGARVLVASLSENTTLLKLNIKENKISKEEQLALSNFRNQNMILTQLIL
ncbi:hypothetical protein BC937DRAFT_86469 [Endogone sp. FLAS-F59071]|nr:hypothetical protein BC937DRAFT_86469 [Endogone sp. FLAS-F59071]|eukprot:RUS22832.1 hypothetical protein BC937DRAFT_86469 [Endogone sp. FLAS-F59071]